MSLYLNRELILFACSIWQGAFLSMCYDLLRLLRRLIPHKGWLVSTEDFLYWMFASWYLLVSFYKENSGILRGYLFFGIALGALVWHQAFSRMVVNGCVHGIRRLLRPFGRLWSRKKRKKRLKKKKKRDRMGIDNKKGKPDGKRRTEKKEESTADSAQ